MDPITLCIPSPTAALEHAATILKNAGITTVSRPEDAEYLLYPIPTPPAVMADYTGGKAVIGGNLDFLCPGVRVLDLLKDPYYLCDNAAITAEAALGLILSHLRCSITDARILILGWGRIGKCLTHQLRAMNAQLTVYARRPEDLAMLRALGYHPISREQLAAQLHTFRCVVNTVPAVILTADEAQLLRPDCFAMDLASVPCIPSPRVLHARGLPGKEKPESSGRLIARTVLYHLKGGRV